MEKKLPKVFKRKWVAALRSGEFKQGDSRLYRDVDDSYCCLGVACAIAGIPKEKIVGGYIFADREYDASKIPKLILGNNGNPVVGKVAGFNDEGKSFNWIASYIERYL